MATKQFKDYTDKTTPIDTDISLIQEVWLLVKKVTWANIKATLKTYFDTLYAKVWSVWSTWITMNTSKILWRSTASVGAIEEISVTGSWNVVLTTNPTITKPTLNGTVNALTADTDGATITFDMSASNIHTVTLGGNRTLAVSNVSVGQCFILRLQQDATGSRTVTWFTTIKWAGGSAPTLTTTASKADLIWFICTSAGNYDWFLVASNI